jgi:hypothetical protein
VKQVARLERTVLRIELGGDDPHVRIARAREFVAHGTLRTGILDRGAELARGRGVREDETLDEEVGWVLPLVLAPQRQSQVGGGRQPALQLGERDAVAALAIFASETPGADDGRAEQQQVDERACPQPPPVG